MTNFVLMINSTVKYLTHSSKKQCQVNFWNRFLINYVEDVDTDPIQRATDKFSSHHSIRSIKESIKFNTYLILNQLLGNRLLTY